MMKKPLNPKLQLVLKFLLKVLTTILILTGIVALTAAVGAVGYVLFYSFAPMIIFDAPIVSVPTIVLFVAMLIIGLGTFLQAMVKRLIAKL